MKPFQSPDRSCPSSHLKLNMGKYLLTKSEALTKQNVVFASGSEEHCYLYWSNTLFVLIFCDWYWANNCLVFSSWRVCCHHSLLTCLVRYRRVTLISLNRALKNPSNCNSDLWFAMLLSPACVLPRIVILQNTIHCSPTVQRTQVYHRVPFGTNSSQRRTIPGPHPLRLVPRLIPQWPSHDNDCSP